MIRASLPAAAAPSLTEQFRALPDEAFTRLQYLSPVAGCFNRCAFCSQEAGQDVWQLTAAGLTDVATALADVAAERGLRIGGGRIHRPGVLFPYLDNDIGSYPYLDTLCELARDVLRVQLRISTVGYSSSNLRLASMHSRIAAEYGDVFAGIRISLTPYTAGWSGRAAEPVSRAQFATDLAGLFATYRPVFARLGHSPATAAVELRFSPLAGIGKLTDTVAEGRHVLACGPHLLISREAHRGPLPVALVERLDDQDQPVLSADGRTYLHLQGDRLGADPDVLRAALSGRLTVAHRASTVIVHRLANADGDYYAADPGFHSSGHFTALHLYPATETRRQSGYTDATRWLLNAILDYKAERGLGRRDTFAGATWDDVSAVMARLAATAGDLAAWTDQAAANHLREVVIPLAETYITALRLAAYPAELFFSRDFTIDTGQIVNQGRAMGLFRGMASAEDEPMTPREERGYGNVSLSAMRGPIWRISPVPQAVTGKLARARAGGKNTVSAAPSLIVEELDPRHLRPVTRGTSTTLRRYAIIGADIEHITLSAWPRRVRLSRPARRPGVQLMPAHFTGTPASGPVRRNTGCHGQPSRSRVVHPDQGPGRGRRLLRRRCRPDPP